MTKFYYSLLLFFIFCQLTKAQELDTTMWVANGDVNAVTKAGNTIYLAGSFNHIGPNTGGGAVFDPATKEIQASFPRINGKIEKSIPDGSGGWFLAGEFTKVGSVAKQKLIHILPDYTMDLAWNPVIDGPVKCMDLSNNILFIRCLLPM